MASSSSTPPLSVDSDHVIFQAYRPIIENLDVSPDNEQRAEIRQLLNDYQIAPLSQSGLCANKKAAALTITLLAIAAVAALGLMIAAIISGGLALPILAGIAACGALAAGGYLTYLAIKKAETPNPASYNWQEIFAQNRTREQLIASGILNPLLTNASDEQVELLYWKLDHHAARWVEAEVLKTRQTERLQELHTQSLADIQGLGELEQNDQALLVQEAQITHGNLLQSVNNYSSTYQDQIIGSYVTILQTQMATFSKPSTSIPLSINEAVKAIAQALKASYVDLWENICDEMSEFTTVLPKLVLVYLLRDHKPAEVAATLRIPEDKRNGLAGIKQQVSPSAVPAKKWPALVAALCDLDQTNGFEELIRDIGTIYDQGALPKETYGAFRAAIQGPA